MKMLMAVLTALFLLMGCTESERPAAQAKQALDAAQQAADDTAAHAKEMAEKAQKMLNE